jgi:two-component system response regulator MprA
MMKRIQVVEDEPHIAHVLASGLTFKGFEVSIASNGTSALKKVAEMLPDAVILDVMLPDINGFEVCRRLRATNATLPILMLTARTATADKVTGLDCGADDYITKPFDFDELLARIRAGLRRGAQQSSHAQQLGVGDMVIDPVTREVWRAGHVIELTRREYDLLELLARNARQILTPAIIFERVWGDDLDVWPEVLKVYIHALRKKLNGNGQADMIHSIRGVGYMLKP